MRVQFKDAPVGALLRTACGNTYRKRSGRTIEFAPGHSHYQDDARAHQRWFYVYWGEVFELVEDAP